MPRKNIKNILFLDFETYYAADYTLRSMTVPEYLLDQRYETIMCAVAANNDPSRIIDGPDFGEWLAQYDPETTATVTFNALFDNAILAWHYGFVPARMIDSMNMARALRGHVLPRLNLATVGEQLLGQAKGHAIAKVQGLNRDQIKTMGLWSEFSAYAINDNDISRAVFHLLRKEMPAPEWRIMDRVIRCAVQPQFLVDVDVLKAHLAKLKADKADLIYSTLPAGWTPGLTPIQHSLLPARIKQLIADDAAVRQEAIRHSSLTSTKGFQAVLESHGVVVKYKTSPATGKLAPQFAKTDPFMAELLEHPDPKVQALAAARVGVKSTLEETRTEKFLRIADLPWSHYRDGGPRFYSGGTMPVPLKYAGAHTHRLSGDWKMNMQNMTRGSQLRFSLVPQDGNTVIVADKSQIEARLVAWLAGCTRLLDTFSRPGQKGDPYSSFASKVFGFVVDKDLHPVHRFIGKTGVLGLGYGCGEDKFCTMVETSARAFGIDLSQVGWSTDLGKRTVKSYREDYHEIPALWRRLDWIIENIWGKNTPQVVKLGPVEIGYGRVTGPSGLTMWYDRPYYQLDEWGYHYGNITHKIYGAKFLENIIQFLSRIDLMHGALRIEDRGYPWWLQAHDELGYIVPDAEVTQAKQIIYQEFTRPPSWGKDIPLDADVKSGNSYGACK